MNTDSAIQSAGKEMDIIFKKGSAIEWMEELASKINSLLTSDFNKLVSILYRMDVSEKKLKQLLQDNPATDAGKLIAELMIEREAEKIKSRKEFKQRDRNIDEDEKW
jgi:hypothetical protein